MSYNSAYTGAQIDSAVGKANLVLQSGGTGHFPDGTAAAPSVGFKDDPNTGFYRPAADQIGAATNGIMRWLLSSTAFKVDVPITGSAVVSSETDTTSGKIPTVGWMGVGATGSCPTATDVDDYTMAAGMWRITATTSNRPFDLGTLLVIRNGPSRVTQLAHKLLAGGVHGSLMYRHYFDAEWSTWAETYSSENLVGTVSQSGGVPTGAAIERGSNANGEYVRFADGTQICWGSFGASNSSADVTWTFPATFSVNPQCFIASGPAGGVGTYASPVSRTTTTLTYSTWTHAGARVSTYGYLQAIGRWF